MWHGRGRAGARFRALLHDQRDGKGTGLALSQVYGFAKQSGGTAQIESEVGRGTTVRIYLPRHVSPPTGDAAVEQEVSDPAHESATVLIVEDDPHVCEMVAGSLADFGYRTLIARTAPEALAILQNDRSVDLLLSDVVMPAA